MLSKRAALSKGSAAFLFGHFETGLYDTHSVNMFSWDDALKTILLPLRRIIFSVFLTTGLISLGSGGHAATQPKPGSVFRDCTENCPQMVVVPPGAFKMGSDEVNDMRGGEKRTAGPVRQITIAKPFAVGKYEVTNAEYAAFVDATGYRPSTVCGFNQTENFNIDFRGPLFGKKPEANAPVVCVSWNDAIAYTMWLSGKTGKRYRLLTEAEWEYAARAGSTTKWPWGDDDAQACLHENIYDLDGEADMPGGGKVSWSAVPCHDGHATLAPVGSYPPNAFGLHDMLGNAWEWVEDCVVQPYPAAPVDGSAVEVQGVCEKRGVRGASWYTRLDRHVPSFRGADTQVTSSHQFGFRVARSL
jgi:formylglycine-generating enzyme required for sulfatase activity